VNSSFKGPMTGAPLPGVSKKIRKLLLARQEVADTIERLIAILDEIDGEAELEPTGDEDEPTLGWPAGVARVTGSTMDGEAEPSLGWTDTVNQASHNRQGDSTTFSLDGEKDDADDEDSDPGEESDEGELDPDLEACEDASDAKGDPVYAAKLRDRGPPSLPVGFPNLIGLDGERLTLVRPW
jgi:hypothetical protein